jgi:hypothetical protein
MSQTAEYCEWSINAAPVTHGDLYRACAQIELDPTEGEAFGLRFVFSDLGDYEKTREQAEARSTAWVKRWIDENFGHP